MNLRSTFHYSKIWNSPPQQRIFAFLRQRGKQGATGLEIEQACGIRNAATWISSINKNLELHGWVEFPQGEMIVECRYERETENGARVYRYYLRGRGEQIGKP